jgi:hypothetical protein
MAYPYTSTLQGLRDTLQQLRSSFPLQITADTLKKWSIAPNNEGPVLNVLRFLGIIDEQGNKQSEAVPVFVEHDDSAFAEKFGNLVHNAYQGLFAHWGEQAWSLDRNRLITFFRMEDHSTARVGQQQAMTFEALASLAGHSTQLAESTTPKTRKVKSSSRKRTEVSKRSENAPAGLEAKLEAKPPSHSMDLETHRSSPPAFTVRIEINLPVAEDQEVYDRIFRSIRGNLYP